VKHSTKRGSSWRHRSGKARKEKKDPVVCKKKGKNSTLKRKRKGVRFLEQTGRAGRGGKVLHGPPKGSEGTIKKAPERRNHDHRKVNFRQDKKRSETARSRKMNDEKEGENRQLSRGRGVLFTRSWPGSPATRNCSWGGEKKRAGARETIFLTEERGT